MHSSRYESGKKFSLLYSPILLEQTSIIITTRSVTTNFSDDSFEDELCLDDFDTGSASDEVLAKIWLNEKDKEIWADL